MLGLMEYIVDIDVLFTHLRHAKCDLVLSYCVTDLTTDFDRASLGWINHLSLMDLAVLFDRFGFRVERSDRIDESTIPDAAHPDRIARSCRRPATSR